MSKYRITSVFVPTVVNAALSVTSYTPSTRIRTAVFVPPYVFVRKYTLLASPMFSESVAVVPIPAKSRYLGVAVRSSATLVRATSSGADWYDPGLISELNTA